MADGGTDIRITTHRSARCPWCGGPVIRDDRLIEGYLKRMVVCLSEDACGWAVILTEPPQEVQDAAAGG